MSVLKLLSRVVTPDVEGSDDPAWAIHDYTFGITSDPLAQLAIVYSALIHDLWHPGVPNAQLIKEKDKVAAFYDGKSIAEQKSVDDAWVSTVLYR